MTREEIILNLRVLSASLEGAIKNRDEFAQRRIKNKIDDNLDLLNTLKQKELVGAYNEKEF